MKILLQHVDTKMFLGDGLHWVREKDQAKDFKNSAEAIQFCVQNQIENAEIILAFQDSQYDVRLKSSPPPGHQP